MDLATQAFFPLGCRSCCTVSPMLASDKMSRGDALPPATSCNALQAHEVSTEVP